MVPHSKPFLGAEEKRALARVVDSGQIAQGPEVGLLEGELAAYVGHRHGVAVSSGTAALYCALRALKVGKGDSVVIPSYVCTALLNAVVLCGATPALADVDPRSGNMTPENAKRALRRKTAAIVVPHLFGYPARAAETEALGVPVIEDCAQCVGAMINGKRVGSLTTISVFSFYATKVLAAGEGGLVATSNAALAGRIRELREYDKRERYRRGFNFKMSDLHAALARAQLGKIDRIVRRRRELAQRYRQALQDVIPLSQHPPLETGVEPMYYRYVIRSPGGTRTVIRAMEARGITCERPVYRPLHRYLNEPGLAGTEEIHRRALSIPLYPSLSGNDAAGIIDALAAVMETP